jgi:CIC family chloride channel protein
MEGSSEKKESGLDLILSVFRKLTSRQFLLVSSVIVALWTGISAVILKVSVHKVQEVLLPLAARHGWIYFVAPSVGILLSILFVWLVLGGVLRKGTYHVIASITKHSSRLPSKETFGHVVTSALTVGFGGSAGLESPIVQTGAAIGSTYAKLFPVGYRDRTILLACGAAAGISTAFNAPIAGVLFALEVLLVDVSVTSFIPLLIAGAVGALCSNVILAEGITLSFRDITPFNYHNTLYYILLGLSCGLVSVLYLRLYSRLDVLLNSVFKSAITRYVFGCVLLGLLILILPPLFGEGYTSIKNLAAASPSSLFQGSILEKWFTEDEFSIYAAVFLVALIKVFAVSFTLNAGGNGGNFAPSLLIGACVGFSLAAMANFVGLTHLPLANFCVVAMAGVLTGIFHAPLTAIFLIAEITGGYELIIPLMIVAAISTAVSKYFNSRSLDEAKLYKVVLRESDPRGRDVQILSQLSVAGIIEKDFIPVQAGSTLRTLTTVIGKSKRNVFPVINSTNQLMGIISLEDIREMMFDSSLYDTTLVDKMMRTPAVTADLTDSMDVVMDKFDKSGVWNIPVLSAKEYVGFISKSAILASYREQLRDNQH